ncbi:MAG: Fe-Mn family superoxide dismutase [Vicinamibacteria bacterium]
MDCYEHAFYVDYKNKKGDYVSAYPARPPCRRARRTSR